LINIDENRIEWVDIFKALTIISVVIGHATGAYNMFIYQFHMAAFFFISGYTTNLKKRSTLSTIWNKACTMILPILTVFVIGLVFITILDQLGIYKLLFVDSFIGFGSAVYEMITRGNNYVLWMGATWFVIVLFEAVVLQKILHRFWGDKANLGYIISTILLFLLGYFMIGSNLRFQFGIFTLDLLLIAQFYFGVGVVFKEYNIFEKITSIRLILVAVGFLSITFLYFFGTLCPTTVDYPSRHFGTPFIDAIAAINGTVFIYVLSIILAKVPKKMRAFLDLIGQNTIGIVFFHFMFFKISFSILYFCGVIPLSGLQNFIPSDEIGRQFWWLFTIVSILLSIILWKALTKIRPLRFLLGEEKHSYSNTFEKICKKPVFQNLNFPSLDVNKCLVYLNPTINYIKKHYVYSSLISIIAILSVTPMLVQGIICNDELQGRFARMLGIGNYLNVAIGNELRQGRPLRILAAFDSALSFTSSHLYVFKGIQICIILMTISLFGYFIYRLFENKRFSVFVCIFTLVFLPITFEHAVPNAFVGLTCMPMVVLLLSFIFYINFLKQKNKSSLFISMILFFIAMLGYEFIITFILVFPMLYFAKTQESQVNFKNFIKTNIIPFVVGFTYLCALLISQKLFSNGYEGAQLGFISIKSSCDIIGTLFKSALPGYYLFNPKYEYLFNIYSNHPFPISSNLVQDIIANPINILQRISIMGNDVLKFIINNFFTLRVFLLFISLGILLIALFADKANKKLKRHTIPFSTLFCGLAYTVLPSLPNALSKMYQGKVSSTFFTSLPVSYFMYFAACFTICSIIWMVIENCHWKHTALVASIILCLYCLPVQAMNSVFSNEQYNNYFRLTSIEELFQTKSIKNMEKQTIWAPDLYQTKNLLAIHDGFWQQYAQAKGITVEIHNAETYNGEVFSIFYPPDNYFILSGGNEIVVLSKTRLIGTYPIKVADHEYPAGDFEQEQTDGVFYCYKFLKTEENGAAILSINTSPRPPFENMHVVAGNTLSTANIISGKFNDGWVGKLCEFEIQTGVKGKLLFKGYYPNKITGKETGTIYINNKPYAFTIPENNFTIELDAPTQSIVNVKIESDFSFAASGSDVRTLSFILSDVQGQ